MIITIDGPAASGKSTVAQLLAQRLGFYYLYTGMLYRGIAYVLAHKCNYTDQQMMAPRQQDIEAITHDEIFVYRYENGQPVVFYAGENITPYLKNPDVDRWASMISSHQAVRQAVLERQVNISKTHDVIAEGRDVGTVVFPHAQYKFFLTASPEIRARRWQADQKRRGFDYTLEQALQAVMDRDRRDQERKHSPLIQAPDAHLIDNSDLSIEQTVSELESYIQ